MGHSCELLLQTAVRGLRELDTQRHSQLEMVL